jgi:hypothetical protein
MSGKAFKTERNKWKKAFEKASEQNRIMVGHLLSIAADPQSEIAQNIITFYKQKYDELKQKTIDTDSNGAGTSAAV